MSRAEAGLPRSLLRRLAEAPIEEIRRKLDYLVLQAAFGYAYSVAWLYALAFRRRRTVNQVRKIAAVWYCPPDQPGSDLRLGNWKPFFERDGLVFDNFSVSSFEESVKCYENGSWSQRYRFYRRVLLARLKQFFRLRHYDLVWIHRGFVPFYPLRRAFLERCLRRMVDRVVVDTTDGSDFQQNPELMLDTIAQADTVTVASEAVRELYSTRHPHVVQFAWAVPTEGYSRKRSYQITGRPVLGWMGSPGNMQFLKRLEPQLQAVARERPYVLRVICRDPTPLNVPNAEVEYHGFDDRYYELLSTFDIGLCPILDDDIASRGKSTMKHQEYMICAIPQICSPFGISEAIEDGETALVATRPEDWVPKLLRLMEDQRLREKLGGSSRALFERLYTYEVVYPSVFRALTDFTRHCNAHAPEDASGEASGLAR